MKRLNLPGKRIVFLGDNLNDLDTGQANKTHFIGFHLDPKRQQRLIDADAKIVTGDHTESVKIIGRLLGCS